MKKYFFVICALFTLSKASQAVAAEPAYVGTDHLLYECIQENAKFGYRFLKNKDAGIYYNVFPVGRDAQGRANEGIRIRLTQDTTNWAPGQGPSGKTDRVCSSTFQGKPIVIEIFSPYNGYQTDYVFTVTIRDETRINYRIGDQF